MTGIETALLVNLAKEAAGLGLAAWQNKQANSIDDTRPSMPIPQAQMDAVSLYKTLMGQDMPGMNETRASIDQNLARTSRKVTSVGGSSPEMLAAIVGAGSEADQSRLQLGGQNATYKAGMVDGLARELGTLAGYENKKWEWDNKGLFEENTAAKGALGNAAINNSFNSFNDIMGAIMMHKMLVDGTKKATVPPTTPPASVVADDAANFSKGMTTPSTENDVSLLNSAYTPNPTSKSDKDFLMGMSPEMIDFLLTTTNSDLKSQNPMAAQNNMLNMVGQFLYRR